jgi:diguanylate cyclase (GGDEF)-like protein
MKKANGELLWTSISCRLVAHAEEAVLVACIIDLSERKKYEDQLYTQAHHDNLTGLPNRKLAFDKLDLALAKAVIEKNHVALLYIDVDRFKNINDSLGHVAGDQLLIELASRLSHCVRSNDTVARLAGDEFAIILPEQESSEGAKIVAEKIIEACLPLVSVGERKVPISVSIGITLFPDDAIDIEQLIRSADTAMYQSKAAGRNQFCFFTPQMHEQEDESRMLEK